MVGGAGYVGSHVVRALLEAGHEPVVYDNLSTGHMEAVCDSEVIIGDVGDRDKLRTVLQARRFDGVVHLAAASLVAESMREPSVYFRNNVSASIVLFDELIRADVPWVVLSSTAAVYGEPEVVPIPEEHPTRPTNPYGESKLMLERILKWYDVAYGFKHISLRYFNAAGAHPSGQIGEDHMPETHLIPIVLQVALGLRDFVTVFGIDYPTPDGSAVRDYVHVCDLADAHVRAITRLCATGTSSVYNLGSARGYSVREIVDVAQQVVGMPIKSVVADRRAGDPPILVADNRKALSELQWMPQFDLEAIVETAWRWHRDHPQGYGNRRSSI
ncbi:UDP-glucose 4-epimerase [Symbiobacterium thermophilum IAM 14863]|uniref:UDP-glucose 4-epimerase n=1 Tax=Symbiobacterium thermophilum (strain DSM 24528 / JCM 14929 / IAM 14863 / T) TaxID=292459 RepID=Q67KV0_SYMTH|nr:UDP-glucose 4-epimerase [Symbiobacterium thermophilum IAM 14863]